VWNAPAISPGPVVWYEVHASFNPTLGSGTVIYNSSSTTADFLPGQLQHPVALRAVSPEGEGPFVILPQSSASGQGGGASSTATFAGSGVGVLVLAVVVVIFVRRKTQRMAAKAAAAEEWEKPVAGGLLLYGRLCRSPRLTPLLRCTFSVAVFADEFEYPANKLVLGRKLGSGAFGTVYEAFASGIGEFSGRTKARPGKAGTCWWPALWRGTNTCALAGGGETVLKPRSKRQGGLSQGGHAHEAVCQPVAHERAAPLGCGDPIGTHDDRDRVHGERRPALLPAAQVSALSPIVRLKPLGAQQ
jgi:hypothetical protein